MPHLIAGIKKPFLNKIPAAKKTTKMTKKEI